MTIPSRKILKNSRGFSAQAEVGINSPVQTNSQNVNVIVSPSLTKDKVFATMNKSNDEHKELAYQERKIELNEQEEGLNDELETQFKERSIESAKNNLDEFTKIVKDKDNLIEALSLILDIYENNPLVVNKLIVAKEDELSRLLFLLTGAEQIEFIKSDKDVSCCMKPDKFTYIQKIMIKKDGNTYNFKYSFPNCVALLENRKISYKIVC